MPSTKKRPNAAQVGVGDGPAKRKRGRPRAAFSFEELERLLLRGWSPPDIATELGHAASTVQRRIAEARAEHGSTWGKPIAPPTREQPVERPVIDEEDPAEWALALLRELALAGTRDDGARVAAARALLADARRATTPAPTTDAPAALEGLLDAVLAATRDAEERPVTPGLSIVG